MVSTSYLPNKAGKMFLYKIEEHIMPKWPKFSLSLQEILLILKGSLSFRILVTLFLLASREKICQCANISGLLLGSYCCVDGGLIFQHPPNLSIGGYFLIFFFHHTPSL